MNGEASLVYKKDFIDKLFTFSLSYVNKYSSFIYEGLDNTWNLYVHSQSSVTKRKRYHDKLVKDIEKLATIEERKSSYYDYSLIADDMRNCVDSMEFRASTRFVKDLMQEIYYIGSLSQLLQFLLDKNDDLDRKIIRKEINQLKERQIMLPQKAVTKKQAISYVVDKYGYIYANLVKDKNTLVFDKKSFEYENKLFEEAVKEDKELLMLIPNEIEGKISPYEKKRRIYLQTMLDLLKRMNKLASKKIDITHPVDQYYYCSKTIVDNLYKETCDFGEKKSVLNLLMNETVKAYGCERMLKEYEHVSIRFIDKVKELDTYSSDEIYNTSLVTREKGSYFCFRNVHYPIPVLDDIYHVLNDKLILSVNTNFKTYFNDLDNTLERFTKYMNEEEIVRLYSEFKDAIFKKSKYSSAVMNEKYIQLQMAVSKIISKKMNISIENATNEYLKEEVAYK